MRVIDYNELLKEHKPKGYVSSDADTIANTLICQLCIQAGSGLARFLKVDNYYNPGELYYITIAGVLSAKGNLVKEPIRKIFVIEK